MTRRLVAVTLVLLLGACDRTYPRAEAPPPPVVTTPPAPTQGPASPTPTAPTRTTSRPAPPPPVPPFPPSLRGQDLERLPTTSRIVALTFDAGANADGVPSILATLTRERITATFFLTGDFVTDFPNESRAIVDADHRLANHSTTHPHFPQLSDAALRTEVTSAEQTMRQIAGADPKPFFRFPFGDRDSRTITALNALGYVCVRWTVDSLGWQGREKHTADSVAQHVLAAATPGQIVLMHVGSHPTDRSTLDADALPAVIAGLRERGYGFVTLDDLR